MEEENILLILRQYVESNVNLMGEIKKVMDYRSLRTQQAILSQYCYEYDRNSFNSRFKEVRNAGNWDRDEWNETIKRLDRDRRETHNKALLGFINILEYGETYGLPKLYTGRKLTKEDVYTYNTAKYDIRGEMTNGMFEMLYQVETSQVVNREELRPEVIEIKKNLERESDQFGVKQPIRVDESKESIGGIELFDNYINNIFNITENL